MHYGWFPVIVYPLSHLRAFKQPEVNVAVSAQAESRALFLGTVKPVNTQL